jgi:hypothetical protein
MRGTLTGNNINASTLAITGVGNLIASGLYSVYARVGPGASDYGTGSGVTNFYISATFAASIYVQAYLINASDSRIKK